MEIIAFERGIRCNPPPSPSFPFESRPRPTEVRDPDLFSIGFNTAIHRNAHGFPLSLPPGGKVVLSKAGGGIRARGEKETPSSSRPTWANFLPTILTFPLFWTKKRGRGPKNSCGFHVARKRRRNNVDTGRVANPGCSTRRLDYTADLSERHWVR